MWAILVGLAQTKIGRGIIGAAIIGFFIFTAFVSFKFWLASHDKQLLSRYVLLAEKTAAESRANEMERQRNAASLALEDHRKRLAASEAAEEHANARLEKEIAEYEKALSAAGRACSLDDLDRSFLLNP
jgi:hypothetical protein